MGKSSTSTYVCQNRHGTYYARLVIPRPLQNQFNNKREIRRSLQTDSKRLAIRRARAYRVQFDTLIDALMSEHDDTEERSPQADIDALKGSFGAIQATFEGQHIVTLPGGKKTIITAKIERNLASMDETDRHKEHLLRQLREEDRREQETAEMAQRERRTEELHQAQLTAITAAATLAPAPTSIQQTGKTVSEYFDDYFTYKTAPNKRNTWSLGTRRQFIKFDDCGNVDKNRGKLGVFHSIFGNRLAASLTREDMDRFIEIAYRIPSNFGNPTYKKFEGVTLDMVVNGSPELDAIDYKVKKLGTVREDLKYISAFLNYIVERKDVTGIHSALNALNNEISDINYTSEKRSFAPEELKTLFEHNPSLENYISGFSKAIYYWLPMIALYSGMRLAEICQLHLNDIKQVKSLSNDSSHWVFDVNEDDDKSLKCGKLNIRQIPIHKNLIDAGLLEYAEALRAKKETKLFPDIARDSSNQFGSQSQWFGIYSGNAGVTDEATSFHSFRHNFTGQLKSRFTQSELSDALTGHKNRSTADAVYDRSKERDIYPLVEVVNSIDYGLNHPPKKY